MPIKIVVKTGLQGPAGESAGETLHFDWLPSDGVIKTITHNQNSIYLHIQIVDKNTGEHLEVDDMIHLSSNVLQLISSEEPEGLGWVVIIK